MTVITETVIIHHHHHMTTPTGILLGKLAKTTIPLTLSITKNVIITRTTALL